MSETVKVVMNIHYTMSGKKAREIDQIENNFEYDV